MFQVPKFWDFFFSGSLSERLKMLWEFYGRIRWNPNIRSKIIPNSPNCFEVSDSSTPTCSGQWLSWQSNVPLPWIGRPQPRSFCFTPWAFRRTPITDPKTSLHVTKPGTAASLRLIRKIYEQFVVNLWRIC